MKPKFAAGLTAAALFTGGAAGVGAYGNSGVVNQHEIEVEQNCAPLLTKGIFVKLPGDCNEVQAYEFPKDVKGFYRAPSQQTFESGIPIRKAELEDQRLPIARKAAGLALSIVLITGTAGAVWWKKNQQIDEVPKPKLAQAT